MQTKKNAQDVKSIVSILNSNGCKEAKQHSRIHRPWGSYLSLFEEKNNWLIKKIEVNPGSSLSLQMHKQRSEHWIVVEGTAEVQINNQKTILTKNQSTFIPIGAKHRLSNPSNQPLHIIEVQCGCYLGEDDIVRFEDQYGRINN